MGQFSGQSNLTGTQNVFIGRESGLNQLGGSNTYVGAFSGDAAFTLSNSAAFGFQAQPIAINDMILGNNNVEVGIGLSDIFPGPGNSLEINESVTGTFSTANTAGGTGLSGVRFRDLTSASTPDLINLGPGVLALNTDGDIVYVPDATGGTLGALCTDAPLGDLTADNRVGLNDFAVYFEDGASATTAGINRVSIGYDCGEFRPAKFSVDNVSDDIAIHGTTSGITTSTSFIISGVEGVIENCDNILSTAVRARATDNIGFFNVGVFSTAAGGPAANVAVVGSAFNTSTIAISNAGARFDGLGAALQNKGVGGGAVGTDPGSENFGVTGDATGIGSVNYGIYGSASGAATNWAGFFVGDVMAGTVFLPSDENIKENITPIAGDTASFVIDNLNPVTFTLNTADFEELNLPEGLQFGLISQEVETLLPSGFVKDITFPSVLDSTGAEITPAFIIKGMDYNGFTAILIADAQNTHKLVDSLEARADSLEEVNATQDSLLVDLLNRVADLENCKCVPKPKSQFLGGGDDGTDNDDSKAQQIDVELKDVQNVVLNQNVPNPFAEKTTITYSIPDEVQKAQMLFYNAKGSLINSVDISTRGQGQINVFGEDLSSGIYSYTLVTDGGVVLTKKMVKAK